jgi:hypothetical protein
MSLGFSRAARSFAEILDIPMASMDSFPGLHWRGTAIASPGLNQFDK